MPILALNDGVIMHCFTDWKADRIVIIWMLALACPAQPSLSKNHRPDFDTAEEDRRTREQAEQKESGTAGARGCGDAGGFFGMPCSRFVDAVAAKRKAEADAARERQRKRDGAV